DGEPTGAGDGRGRALDVELVDTEGPLRWIGEGAVGEEGQHMGGLPSLEALRVDLDPEHVLNPRHVGIRGDEVVRSDPDEMVAVVGPEPHQAALLSGGVDAGVGRSAVGVAAAADLVGEAAVGTAQLEGPRAERRGVAEREMLPAGARGLLGGGGPGGGVVARRLTLGAQSW